MSEIDFFSKILYKDKKNLIFGSNVKAFYSGVCQTYINFASGVISNFVQCKNRFSKRAEFSQGGSGSKVAAPSSLTDPLPRSNG